MSRSTDNLLRDLSDKLQADERFLSHREIHTLCRLQQAEIERLRANCNPECPGCGLRPCNEQGKAVLWCDECVQQLREEIRHWQTITQASGTHRSCTCAACERLMELEVK